jgi:Zn-dependent protease
MDFNQITVYLAIILFSVVFHEVAHGMMAYYLGDSTAKDEGRLTLNPIPHIDLFGSILLPGFLLLVNSPILFGAAKPVPVNFNNLRNLRWGIILVAFAGPLTNFVLAGVAAAVYHMAPNLSVMGEEVLYKTILLNLVLALFNLIPIPPLDGSKILASLFGFIDQTWMHAMLALEQYGFILIIIFLYTGLLGYFLGPPLEFMLQLLNIRS